MIYNKLLKKLKPLLSQSELKLMKIMLGTLLATLSSEKRLMLCNLINSRLCFVVLTKLFRIIKTMLLAGI